MTPVVCPSTVSWKQVEQPTLRYCTSTCCLVSSFTRAMSWDAGSTQSLEARATAFSSSVSWLPPTDTQCHQIYSVMTPPTDTQCHKIYSVMTPPYSHTMSPDIQCHDPPTDTQCHQIYSVMTPPQTHNVTRYTVSWLPPTDTQCHQIYSVMTPPYKHTMSPDIRSHYSPYRHTMSPDRQSHDSPTDTMSPDIQCHDSPYRHNVITHTVSWLPL